MSQTAPAHSYEEPGINSVLVLSSFLLLLNFVNSVLNSVIHCGLLGQIFIGVAWGTPGAKWLSPDEETAVSQLGYIGLLLLVYEGGLSTSFSSLKANLAISVGIAITGIVAPIGLSFVLHSFLGASYLQCFAAGAALCSTSLGTTFTVLSSTGLTKTRLGVALTSAAMMDDVVGLVMVEVISKLGSGGSLRAVTLLRPILTSVGFAVLVPLICWLGIRPLARGWHKHRGIQPMGRILSILAKQKASLVFQILVLVGMSAAGSYAGTSNLFTAYMAGACTTWWDSEVAEGNADRPRTDLRGARPSNPGKGVSGIQNYQEFLQQANDRFLVPCFFASIGFSIPISTMFSGPIIWKGLVYACLMAFGKLLCGLWLLPISSVLPLPERPKNWFTSLARPFRSKSNPAPSSNNSKDHDTVNTNPKDHVPKETETNEPNPPAAIVNENPHTRPGHRKPISLYPAAVLGSAMVARGEIGFLISALAESRGIFSSSPSDKSELFLIVTWAIMLCTILGPITVGVLVRRIKSLDRNRTQAEPSEGLRDVMGDWGIQ